MSSNTLPAEPRTITLQREIDKTKQEIAKLRESIAQLQGVESKEGLPPVPPLPQKYKVRTKYDFPASTWLKETLFVLVCIAGHFFLGITGITTTWYVLIDLVGFVLCIPAIIIALNIKNLNKISFAENSPTRIKADSLARINGWLVGVLFIIGCIVIFYQSANDMYPEIEMAGLITYFIFYFGLFGLVWYVYFRPTNFDFYSVRTSPTAAANAFTKKIYDKELRQWKRDVLKLGYTRDDFDDIDLGDDTDWDNFWDNDSDDYDYDSSDSSDSDWDWGGGDSGGGGASSEW